MKQRRSVALLVETSNAYSRGLLEGVIAYNKQAEMIEWLNKYVKNAKPENSK
ncbi:hypothetical protein N9093_01085 [bacterium]|nr:hypothetical protein [bacterium]